MNVVLTRIKPRHYEVSTVGGRIFGELFKFRHNRWLFQPRNRMGTGITIRETFGTIAEFRDYFDQIGRTGQNLKGSN